jgi:thiamine-monophosphate kinase
MPSEFDLISRYFTRPAPNTVLGAGDDCALLRPTAGMELAVSTDMLVAGTHFFADTDPADLGWKTLAVNVSDVAAMGAAPRWATLGLALPAEIAQNEAWLDAFSDGFFACADAYDVALIGGDTTRGPLAFSVTIMGEALPGESLRRSGGQAGDEIWVSGTPGLAALGLAHLQGRYVLPDPAPCLAALHRPQPRTALGLALRGIATACIDVSDGLLADLGHILEQSKLAATLHWPALPQAAFLACADQALAQDCLLAGGDDYELLFTAPLGRHVDLLELSRALTLPLHCIGTLRPAAAPALELLDAQGRPLPLGKRGFDHFQ